MCRKRTGCATHGPARSPVPPRTPGASSWNPTDARSSGWSPLRRRGPTEETASAEADPYQHRGVRVGQFHVERPAFEGDPTGADGRCGEEDLGGAGKRDGILEKRHMADRLGTFPPPDVEEPFPSVLRRQRLAQE